METTLPEKLEKRIAKISVEELNFRGWTRAGMREVYLKRIKQDRRSPQVGDKAPDFRLEQLSLKGSRAGDFVSLSSLRDKPVALIFGSYT